ncbi:uncharacterized protein BCR38DRAFT_227427 [Pseudomassariella vexata]|uniref:Uncharacterized protein n=1 Tax=Pseudomassariella vexata TaxID=1141098 RepID=A0A1Y2DVT0_9PEZI|nr:uncharacterized protein BCR38DRAFT_227427 [Pseudomassariella vexata]ORY63400.1 hypothetical protein BCR38DRAFT_227427 [Pseudomassariella vexata]
MGRCVGVPKQVLLNTKPRLPNSSGHSRLPILSPARLSGAGLCYEIAIDVEPRVKVHGCLHLGNCQLQLLSYLSDAALPRPRSLQSASAVELNTHSILQQETNHYTIANHCGYTVVNTLAGEYLYVHVQKELLAVCSTNEWRASLPFLVSCYVLSVLGSCPLSAPWVSRTGLLPVLSRIVM